MGRLIHSSSALHISSNTPPSQVRNPSQSASFTMSVPSATLSSTQMSGSSQISFYDRQQFSTSKDVVSSRPIRLVNLSPEVSFGARVKPSTLDSFAASIGILFETNEDGKLLGFSEGIDVGSLTFQLKHVDLMVKQVNLFDENPERFVLQFAPSLRKKDDEWTALFQGRIYSTQSCCTLQLVYSDMFELGNRMAPLELELTPEIVGIKIELRYVYQFYREMPDFRSNGDLKLYFADDEENPLFADRALLSLYAPKFVDQMPNLEPNRIIMRPDWDCYTYEFRELLYQAYRTRRPLHANFSALCKCATKFGGELLLWPLYQKIIRDDRLEFREKVKKAAAFGLDKAVHEICYDAVKAEMWQKLQHEGFDAHSYFGDQVYYQLVCPAIIEAIKDKNNPDPAIRGMLFAQKYPRQLPTFTSCNDASNPNNARLLIDGREYYVNIGVLKVSGCMEKLVCSSEGLFHPILSANLISELERIRMPLGQLILPLLHFMHGYVTHIDAQLVRAALIFAYDNGMRGIVEDMEQLLLNEPVLHSEALLDHLQLAQQYELKNLERHSLWQLEWREYHGVALDMISLPGYSTLNQLLQNKVEDRICSGWALQEPKLAKREPMSAQRIMVGQHGASPVYEVEPDDVNTHKLVTEKSFEMLSDCLGSGREDIGQKRVGSGLGLGQSLHTAVLQ